MKISGLELKNGLILAPMAGITDAAFRKICFDYGADFTVSEMVSAKAVCYGDKKTDSLARLENGEGKHTSLQIFGSESEFMAKAAAELLKYEPAAIDINMGCPVRKVTGNGEGSALLKNPPLIGEIVSAVVKAVSIPVTVKIRAGWDSTSVNAPEVAKIIEAAGASMITVHARTREQMYEPGVDRSVIKAVKEAVSIPVLGNGDIYTAADALSMMEETGCDGVMIARGAMGNPWIFSEIRAALEGKSYTPPPAAQRFEVALAQVREMIGEKGERVGIAEAKKHLSWYCHGMEGAAAARGRLMQATTYDELAAILREMGGRA